MTAGRDFIETGRGVASTSVIVSGAVGMFVLVAYVATLAPTVGPVDSGELTVAAWAPGVAHPPGFPFFIVLGHLASLVPAGAVAVRLNALSAICGAVAAAAVCASTLLFLCLLRSASSSRARSTTPPSNDLWVAALAGVLFGILRTSWAYATITEVYTLSTCLIAVTLALMLRWRLAVEEGERTTHWLTTAALLYGVSLAVHPASAVVAGPALALLFARTSPWSGWRLRYIALLAVSVSVGPLLYLLFPWLAMRDPVLNWGDPDSAARLWFHLSGGQYRSSAEFVPEAVMVEVRLLAGHLGRQLYGWVGPLVAVMAGTGAWVLRRHAVLRSTALLWIVVTAGVPVLLAGWWIGAEAASDATYTGPADKDAYYLPLMMMLVLLAAVGVSAVIRALRLPRVAAAVVVVLIIGIILPVNAAFSNRRQETLPRDFAEDVLGTIGPGGLLLTRDWHLHSPLLYLQHVEAVRLDVDVVDLHFLKNLWYAEQLSRRDSLRLSRMAALVTTYCREVSQVFSARGLNADVTIVSDEDERYRALVTNLIAIRLTTASVYVTREVAFGADGNGRALSQDLLKSYQLVPRGLVFELRSGPLAYTPLEPLSLRIDAVMHPPRWGSTEDSIHQRLVSVYRDMVLSRATYFARWGQHADAIAAADTGVKLDPTFVPGRRLREDLERRR